MSKTLKDQVIWPTKGTVTVDGCDGETEVLFAYLSGPVIPIAAMVKRYQYLKKKEGLSVYEAYTDVMREIMTLEANSDA